MCYVLCKGAASHEKDLSGMVKTVPNQRLFLPPPQQRKFVEKRYYVKSLSGKGRGLGGTGNLLGGGGGRGIMGGRQTEYRGEEARQEEKNPRKLEVIRVRRERKMRCFSTSWTVARRKA